MKIVLASSNLHKCHEIAAILKDCEIESIANYCDNFDVLEDGTTYEANALLKARSAYQICGKPCIADDSGLNVVAMDNNPGIYSARYLGEATSYDIKNQTIIDNCRAKNEYRASFTCVIAYIDASGNEFTFRYDLNGHIAPAISGNHGFGYDPIFIPQGYTDTMAELNSDVKNLISHRYQALQKLVTFLNQSAKLHLVLYHPQIPQNTGNIMRTCAATNAILHLIQPNFAMDEKRMLRSGMDYIHKMQYYIYQSWEEFTLKNPSQHYYFITRYGKKTYSEINYQLDEAIYFVLGSENSGIDKQILQQHLSQCLRIPMRSDSRSLNLSNCAAIILYEALRQQNFLQLSKYEVIKGQNFLEE